MYSNFQMAGKYLEYYWKASNRKGHGMHSPFVFDFIRNVLNNNSGYEPPTEIEDLRQQLLTDERIIEVEDLGAGSRKKENRKRKLSDLAHNALKPPKYAQLLYRLARHYEPEVIVELGTSLGLTTSYFSAAGPKASIFTLEGSTAIAAIARDHFLKLGCRNVQLIEGNFDEQLPLLLQKISSLPLVYIDGNHRYDPTMDYFEQCVARSQNDTILIFDDIHWSAEMEKAWEKIKKDNRVQYTIDIFFLGFVFFRKEFRVKQDFIIRF